jgi:hypothetical protein
MTKVLRHIVKALALATVVCCVCARTSLVNGGVSETTNGVKASIVYQNGTSCSNAVVRLRATEYVAPAPGAAGAAATIRIDSVTDSQGNFHFADVGPGAYMIEVADAKGNALALKVNVPNADSLVDLGTATIRAVGSFRGMVSNTPQGQLFVQVPGLEHIASVNIDDGSFRMDGLPSGTFGLRFVSATAGRVPAGRDSVSVPSNDSNNIGTVPLWRYFRSFALNTGASGADVRETVTDFPVLVRLTPLVFDFSQARSDGGDVRFYRLDTIPLPHEIERWDSASGAAEIWVRLDSIYGSNDSQSMRMFWGNPSALNPAASAAVFDTAAGFQGVWHFGETGNSFCQDATGNQYTGTPYGMSAASSGTGAIGLGRMFDGTASWIQMHGTAAGKCNFPENGTYTLSAWVLLDTVDTGSQVVLSKGYWQYFLKAAPDLPTGGYFWQFTEYHANEGWLQTRYSAAIRSWTYVVAQRRGNRQYLYVNGGLADSGIVTTPGFAARDTGNDLTVGRYIQAITAGPVEGFDYFHGSMDEVRVCSVARSLAWIRLCYMNQKNSDALVQFK